MYSGLWKSWEVVATSIWQQTQIKDLTLSEAGKRLTEIVLNEIKEKEKEE